MTIPVLVVLAGLVRLVGVRCGGRDCRGPAVRIPGSGLVWYLIGVVLFPGGEC